MKKYLIGLVVVTLVIVAGASYWYYQRPSLAKINTNNNSEVIRVVKDFYDKGARREDWPNKLKAEEDRQIKETSLGLPVNPAVCSQDGLAPVRRYEIISQNLTTATVRVHKSYDETFKNYSNTGDYLKYDNYVDVFLAKESGGWAIDSFRCTAVIMHP